MELIRKENGNDGMTVKERNGLYYLQFPLFIETGIVKHLFTTRLGGVSTGDVGTLNLSYTRGDAKENVDENFRRVAAVLETDISHFVLSDQKHTTNIRIVTKEDAGKGITKEKDYCGVDGLITNERGIVLSTFFADCVPLFFVDPKKKVIALVHSGWRGTVDKIGEKTVHLLCNEFGCEREDILAAIGPSICRDCYEVGEEVAYAFSHSFSQKQTEKILFDKKDGKFLLDLWQANYEILLESQIVPNHIAVTDICTSCNKDVLFSHRASKGKRGNLGAFMMLT